MDISTLDDAEIDRLRDADPFMYHSIMRERRRSSLFGLDEDEEVDGDAAVQNIEFDLREMDTGGSGGGLGGSLRGSLRGSSMRRGLRSSLRSFDDHHNVSDSDFSADQTRSNNDGASTSSHNSGSNDSGSRLNGLRGRPYPAVGRRRSSLYNLDEEHESTIDPADNAGGVSTRHHRPFAQSMQPQRTSLANDDTRSGECRRRNSHSNLSIGTRSGVVQRKRRFSTEAHSSLIMANLEASLRGSMLSTGPDLDSLFGDEGEGSDDDGDLLSFLRT